MFVTLDEAALESLYGIMQEVDISGKRVRHTVYYPKEGNPLWGNIQQE